MSWGVLVISAVLEAIWATALGETKNFSAPGATAVFLIALVASMAGLGWASKRIPIGTAYAVWTGLGATLTVSYAMLTGEEPVSTGKLIFMTGVVVAVAGLKVLPAVEKLPTPPSTTVTVSP